MQRYESSCLYLLAGLQPSQSQSAWPTTGVFGVDNRKEKKRKADKGM